MDLSKVDIETQNKLLNLTIEKLQAGFKYEKIINKMLVSELKQLKEQNEAWIEEYVATSNKNIDQMSCRSSDLNRNIVKVYLIEDNDGKKYVGQTIKPIVARYCEHLAPNNVCTSNELDLENSWIKLLEECDIKDKYIIESKWINNIDCVNTNGKK
tara:strand:- start:363 stop:830 length:468 start_codon:yes stop_codon:yes gene_type:complete